MIPDSDGGFRCFACEAVFTTRQALSRHKLKVHGSKTEERFQCPYCSHVGSRAYDVFSRHIRKDHRERAGSTCLNDIKSVRGRAAVPTPLMQKLYTPSSRAAVPTCTPLMQKLYTPSSRAGPTKLAVSSPITHPEEKQQSVAPASVTEATEMGDMSPYTPKFTSGVDGAYPTYYPGGKTIEELQQTPSPLKKRKRITPYWEPESKKYRSTEQELAKPFPLTTPEDTTFVRGAGADADHFGEFTIATCSPYTAGKYGSTHHGGGGADQDTPDVSANWNQ